MIQARINTLYLASEGEGVFVGIPQIFLRFQGCAVACKNCDSKETWSFAKGTLMTVEECFERVLSISHGVKRISITGGDPLHPQNRDAVLKVAKLLKADGFYINIEAAGNIYDEEIFSLVDFISIDYKTPSAGVATPLDITAKMIVNFPHKIQIKSVVETMSDFDYIENARVKIGHTASAPYFWVITPAFNSGTAYEPDRTIQILRRNEESGGHFRVIGQQHKWIFGPDRKDV